MTYVGTQMISYFKSKTNYRIWITFTSLSQQRNTTGGSAKEVILQVPILSWKEFI